MIDRDEHKDNFTVISNDTIRDDRISGDAFKMLAFMLSCDDSFEFSEKGLMSIMGWTKRRTENASKLLQNCGYLEIKKGKSGHGRFGSYVWEVSEVSKNATKYQKPLLSSNLPNVEKTLPIRNNNTKEITNTNCICAEVSKNATSEKVKTERFQKPTIEEVKAYCEERQNGIDPQRFIDYYESNGWRVGKSPMKDWKAAVRNWERNDKKRQTQPIRQANDDLWTRYEEIKKRVEGGNQ